MCGNWQRELILARTGIFAPVFLCFGTSTHTPTSSTSCSQERCNVINCLKDQRGFSFVCKMELNIRHTAMSSVICSKCLCICNWREMFPISLGVVGIF